MKRRNSIVIGTLASLLLGGCDSHVDEGQSLNVDAVEDVSNVPEERVVFDLDLSEDLRVLLHEIAVNSPNVSYVPGDDGVSGKFQVNYALKGEDLSRLLANGFLPNGQRLSEFSNEIFNHRVNRFLNPGNIQGGGVRVDIDEYGLRPLLERLDGVRRNIGILDSGFNWDLARDFPTFDVEGRILDTGILEENIVEYDPGSLITTKGRSDIGDFLNIFGDRVYRKMDHSGLSPEEFLDFAERLYDMQWNVFLNLSTEERKGQVLSHFDSVRNFDGYSLPFEDQVRRVFSDSSGDGSLDLELLMQKRSELEKILETADANDISIYSPGEDPRKIQSDLERRGLSLLVSSNYRSQDSLGESVYFLAGVRRQYPDSDKLNLGVVEVPEAIVDLYPIEIGAGEILRNGMPRSGGRNRVYMLYNAGNPTFFGRLAEDPNFETIMIGGEANRELSQGLNLLYDRDY